ncbi:uncharacterized protein LOC129741628 [Uranotaenia lowii]|nr:uncharacterized protein LOC129741628 [Uranotaenia lowii]
MSRKTQTGKSVRYDGTSKHGNSPASNCKSCGGPETEEMVQCDSCDRWFHFQCVNVTESIAERPWNCADCTSRFEERNPVSTFNFPPNVPPARRSLSHTHPAEENVANVPQTTELMSQLSIPSTNIAPSSIFPPLYNAPTIAFAPSRNINPRLISNQNTQSMPISTTSCSNAVVYPSTMLSAPVPSAVVSISKTPISSRRNALPVTVGNKLPIQRANDERSLRNEGPANQLQQKATTSSRKSTANRAILLELEKLKEEQKHLQEVHKQQMDNINKRYELLAELASESSLGSVAEEIGLDSKVEDWLDQSDGQRVRPFEEELHYPLTHRSTHNVAGPHSYSAPKQAVNQRHSSGKIRFEPQIQPTTSEFQGRHRPSFEHPPGESAQDHHQLGNTQLQTVKDPFFPQHRSTPQHSHFPSVMRNAEIGDLTNSRAAARQAFDRELPTFSGLPEEWPLFLSTFNTTTSMCGFTQEENLIRLQKCLKGKAFDAVRCMLMHPSNVTSIISTLRMLFGNPEVIIYSLISKIQSTPAPRADR